MGHERESRPDKANAAQGEPHRKTGHPPFHQGYSRSNSLISSSAFLPRGVFTVRSKMSLAESIYRRHADAGIISKFARLSETLLVRFELGFVARTANAGAKVISIPSRGRAVFKCVIRHGTAVPLIRRPGDCATVPLVSCAWLFLTTQTRIVLTPLFFAGLGPALFNRAFLEDQYWDALFLNLGFLNLPLRTEYESLVARLDEGSIERDHPRTLGTKCRL